MVNGLEGEVIATGSDTPFEQDIALSELRMGDSMSDWDEIKTRSYTEYIS
jgi:hypothetical protein